jgi:hypothetical protein
MRNAWLFVVALVGFGIATARAETPKAGAAAMETCGQMIAGMAGIPAKLSEGATSVADMLDAHAAIMGKDKEGMAEAKGLRALAKTHRQVAAELTKASGEMKKAEHWPAAPHDMAKMTTDPKLQAANQKVIDTHKEIIAMLQKMVADMETQAKAAK